MKEKIVLIGGFLMGVFAAAGAHIDCGGSGLLPADPVSTRFKAAWESRRGEPYVEVPVSPPIFHGHPRFAQKYSRAIIHFALRVFHNAETNEYALASRKIAENCRFYIENKDVRNDRDSFYWNVGELCRIVLHYGSKGDVAPGLLSPEAEAAFLEMAFGYCHDMSRLSDAAADGMKTWRVYESENHHVQRNSALWQLMHALLKVDPAYGAQKLAHGGTLREHYDAWEAFFCAWMRERAKRSMFIEVQSRVYGIHTIKNVYPLYDFSERSETRRIAKNFIDLFWALWAQEQIDGASGGGMSRVYPSTAVKTASEASAWAYWYFGLNPSLAHKPDGMDYVCLDSAYRPHPLIGGIAADAKARGVYEIEMRPLGWTLPSDKYPNYRPDPEWGRIYRYTYATPDFIVGTQMFPQASGDKWCKISSQNRFHGVVFGLRDAEILPIPAVTGRHAKTVKLPSVGYNAFWSMQKKGTLLTRKNRYANQTGGMRVFFSAAGGVDKVERDGEWWFTKCGGAYSAVRVACGEARLVEAGAGAEIPFDAKGKFLVCADPWAPVIVETARACDFKDEAAFRAKVKATALALTPSALDYTGIYGNRFHMLLDRDDGSTIDGEPYVRKIDWSVKSPFVRMSWCGDVAELTFGGSTVRLDFSIGDFVAVADAAEPPRKDVKQQEIKEWFLENYYGRAPVGRPADMEFRDNEIWISGGKVKIRLDVTLPPDASKDRPCPVVLVADRRSCFPTPIEPKKLKKILAVHDEFRRIAKERGYALVMWNVNDIAPDCWLYDRYIKMKPEELPPNAWGVFGLYGGEPDGRKGDTWGTIRAWAWGHSRVMDWIETRPELDAKRVAVCGHSRLGKTALVAGVTDERFLVAYSNDSGVGGAHPHRLWKPGVCKLSFVNTRHLHWLCLNSRKFEADERNMPHDMDEFLALLAPRYLYVASASEDWWAGPDGEQFAAEMASRAWERMNLKGWGYRGHVGGHVRPGGHDFLPYDFERFLDFCKTPFGAAE